MYSLGPFMVTEVDSLRSLLEKKGVTFEMIADEELRDRLLAEYNRQATFMPSETAGTLFLRYIFVEMEPTEFEKVREDFEKLGIMPPSDGAWELGEDE